MMTVFIVVEYLIASDADSDQRAFRLRRVVDVFDTSRAAWDFVAASGDRRPFRSVVDRDVVKS